MTLQQQSSRAISSYWEVCWGPARWQSNFPQGRIFGGSRISPKWLLGAPLRDPTWCIRHSTGKSNSNGSAHSSCCSPDERCLLTLQTRIGDMKGARDPRKVKQEQNQQQLRQRSQAATACIQPGATHGGGFCKTGAKPQPLQHQQQQERQIHCLMDTKHLRLSRGGPAAAVRAAAARASSAPYRTTDVPWVVAAPAYRQLCVVKGKLHLGFMLTIAYLGVKDASFRDCFHR